MLKPQPIPEIPAETVRVVRAAFPNGNLYIHLRDTLGTIYQDELFAHLYPGRGQPAYVPWRLALVTVFQFMQNLTDRQAADAVRSRLDWKYCLSLELTDAGFDHTVWIQDILMLKHWSPTKQDIREIWWVQPQKITDGKHENRMAML